MALGAAAVGYSVPIPPGFKTVPILFDDATIVEVNTALPPEYMHKETSPTTNKLLSMQYYDDNRYDSPAVSAASTTVVIVDASGRMLLVDNQEAVPVMHLKMQGPRRLQRLISVLAYRSYFPVFLLAFVMSVAGTVYFVLRYGLNSSHV